MPLEKFPIVKTTLSVAIPYRDVISLPEAL